MRETNKNFVYQKLVIFQVQFQFLTILTLIIYICIPFNTHEFVHHLTSNTLIQAQ